MSSAALMYGGGDDDGDVGDSNDDDGIVNDGVQVLSRRDVARSRVVLRLPLHRGRRRRHRCTGGIGGPSVLMVSAERSVEKESFSFRLCRCFSVCLS